MLAEQWPILETYRQVAHGTRSQVCDLSNSQPSPHVPQSGYNPEATVNYTQRVDYNSLHPQLQRIVQYEQQSKVQNDERIVPTPPQWLVESVNRWNFFVTPSSGFFGHGDHPFAIASRYISMRNQEATVARCLGANCIGRDIDLTLLRQHKAALDSGLRDYMQRFPDHRDMEAGQTHQEGEITYAISSVESALARTEALRDSEHMKYVVLAAKVKKRGPVGEQLDNVCCQVVNDQWRRSVDYTEPRWIGSEWPDRKYLDLLTSITLNPETP